MSPKGRPEGECRSAQHEGSPVSGFTREFVERGYNNRAACPDHPHWLEEYARLSAAVYAGSEVRRDLRYGAGPKETLDLFLPAGPARGTYAFFHGGYWRALDKTDFAFVAAPFVARGIAVASVNYDLCPDVSIAHIVDECRRAVAWIAREGQRHGADASRLVIGGHSAGGHLAAMMYVTDWRTWGFERAPFHAGVTLSGVHDLAPMTLFSFNGDLKLDDASARALSPVAHPPLVDAPLLMAVGAAETSEFIRQARLLWDLWAAQRPAGATAPLLVEGKNHFSVIAEYAAADSVLTRATLALF
jgi:arylformamidase